MGQLLVVACHTAYEPSSCYEPELIPDPTTLDISGMIHPRGKRSLLDLGSVLYTAGY